MVDNLEILWEDPHGIAVNKPAGLLVHPGGMSGDEPTLDQQIRRYLRPEDPTAVYLGTVHRLDRPVSGVILWAKTPRAAHRWAEQFRDRLVRKEYWAVVTTAVPQFSPGSDRWEDWLASPDRSGRADVSSEPEPGRLLAVTRVQPGRFGIARPNEAVQFLQLQPETGRTHQLRAQTAFRGHPIVGDRTYGSNVAFGPGIALHARSLALDHPTRRQTMTINATPPPSWLGWLDANR